MKKGIAASKGYAIGKVFIQEHEEIVITDAKVSDVAAEKEKLTLALEASKEQLTAIKEKTLAEIGEHEAAVFEAHLTLLDDPEFTGGMLLEIETNSINAMKAVESVTNTFVMIFDSMEDEYMSARAADIKDISERVIRVLMGKGESGLDGNEPVIVVAEDLAPSETVQLDKSKVLAFVTKYGSSNSHTAILARTMNIPALINVGYGEEIDGKMGIVDGKEGILIVEPDEEVLERYRAAKEEELKKKEMLKELKGKPTVTKSGREMKLYANIGSISDVATVLQNDAGGIGLFRSEFVYLEKSDYPTEEEQFQIYKQVAQNMAGKKVIIRTLDIGADKQVDYFNMDKEENPAMGYRAIRICLDRTEIFKTQLRALFRASAYGKISIMYPMIISVKEVKQIKAIVAEIKAGLDREGIPYGDVEQGIMIETPAAAMISDLLAKEVDFFSIGTNDLTQYTLAIDRQNAKLDNIYDSHHEAVLRMIQMVVDNAHKEGIWAGICGELGADMTLTEKFVKMGVDELSVSPTFILPIRKIIREME